VSAFFVLGIMGVMAFDMLVRGILGTTATWAYEVNLFLFGPYCVLGGAITHRYKKHVSVTIIHDALPVRIRE